MKCKKVRAALLTLTLLLFTAPAVLAEAAVTVRCDTSGTVTLTQATAYTYTFKITVNGSRATPVFSVGNNKAFETKLLSHKGNDYYFQVTGIGKGGDSTGVYTSVARQKAVRQCIVTIAQAHYSYGMFQFYKNFLYYDFDRALYRMSTDGSGKTKVLDENVGYEGRHFLIYNDTVYYTDPQTERLCRIGLDGGNRKVLTNGPVHNLVAGENRIYYLNGSADGVEGTISFYDPDSGTNALFSAAGSGKVTFYKIYGDTMYYSHTPFIESTSPSNWWVNQDSLLESVRLDGSGRTEICSINGMENGFFVQDGSLYAIISQTLYQFGPGTEGGKIADGIYGIYGMNQDWIYASDRKTGAVRISRKTGEKQKLVSLKWFGVGDVFVTDSYLYVSSRNFSSYECETRGEIAGIYRFDPAGKLVGRLTVSEKDGQAAEDFVG